MPNCLKCGTELAVNEEGIAPVLCDRCAGVATSRARRTLATGTLRDFPATVTLMAVSILAYLIPMVTGIDLKFWGANIGPLTLSGEYWRLFSAGFLHADILHIGMNMWCLWSLGRLSERLFGKWQTFVIYMLTGVGGALLSIAWDQGRNELGASGAVFGLVGAVMAGVKFGDLNISAGQKRAIFSSAASFAVLNFVLGMSSGGIFGNIDNMCHLGGFVSGLLIGLPLGAFSRRHQLYQLATLAVTALVLAAAGRELVQVHGPEAQKLVATYAWGQRDFAKAAQLLEKYTAAKPDDDNGLIMLGEAYAANNERDKAIAAFERALKVNPNSQDARQDLQELRGDGPPQK